MEWLKPALAFMALASAVVSASFFYVGTTIIRRRYVFVWAAAWASAIPLLGCTWLLLGDPSNHLVWTLQQVLTFLNVLLVGAGCYELVHRRFPTRLLLVLAIPLLAWAAFAPLFLDRFFELTAPSAVMLGTTYLWTASRFVRLRRQRGTRSALTLAVLFTLAGLHEFDYPLFGNSPWAAPVGFALASLFALAIGMGLLIMVLEEARDDAERERAQLDAILEHLPAGVLVTGPDGNVRLVNSVARPLALSSEGDGSRPFVDLEGEVFRDPTGARLPSSELPISRALASGERSEPREFQMLAADGQSRPIYVHAGPVHDAQGKLLGAVAVLQDLTEIKRMQAEIARSQRLQGIGTLAAGVAHDFNNALTMILGHAELALNATRDPVVRQQMSVVARVAADSAAIVRRLQDVGRTRVARDAVIFDLGQVVREAVEITRPRWRDEAHSRGVRYEVDLEVLASVLVSGQPGEIRESLLNLVFNALDAMPGGGKLSFSVRRCGGEAEVVVGDTGSGMPPEVRERIFDPFFTTKGQRGTGLGLALVFSIIERHRGRVTVDSEVGRGTRFVLRFPVASLAERASTPAMPVPAAIGGSRSVMAAGEIASLRLLVVEDETLVRNLTCSLLRSAGYTVQSAEDGEQALRLAGESIFDVVLTDLGMPGLNGWEVAQGMHRLQPSSRVVLVTGWGETISPEAERAGGISRVLSKPFTKNQLLECVADVSRLPASPQLTAASPS